MIKKNLLIIGERLMCAIYFLWLAFGCFSVPMIYVLMETDERWYHWGCVVIYYLPFLYIKELDKWATNKLIAS